MEGTIGVQLFATEQLLKLVPDDVKIEADIAYRPGDSEVWRLDLATPKSRDVSFLAERISRTSCKDF